MQKILHILFFADAIIQKNLKAGKTVNRQENFIKMTIYIKAALQGQNSRPAEPMSFKKLTKTRAQSSGEKTKSGYRIRNSVPCQTVDKVARTFTK